VFETVPRRVTVYSVLDVIEGTLDLNAGAPRITDWLQSGYDWLLLRDARFPSGLIVSGLISLPEGATWVTAVDVIDDDDRLKPLEDSVLVWDGEALRRDVIAFVRLKAALYLREDEASELVSVLLGEASSGTVRAEPKADGGTVS
jgi:hypothetical protein